jgi:hypothetical protein
MRFITIVPVPLVVVAAMLSTPVVAGEAAQTTAPSHKHYDEPKDAPAAVPGAPPWRPACKTLACTRFR